MSHEKGPEQIQKMRILATSLMLNLIACSPDNSRGDPKLEARRSADAYLDSRSLRGSRQSVVVRDDGENWLVIYYDEPLDASGGEGYVWVNKKTMEVSGTAAAQ